MLTVGENFLKCWRIRLVKLGLSDQNPIDVEVLVEDETILGFILLLGLMPLRAWTE